MRIRLSVILVMALAAASALTAYADQPACQERQDLAGACFTVSGNLRLFNGTPSARILLSRPHHHVLGVEDSIEGNNQTFAAPKEVRDAASFDWNLHGEFKVCPLKKVVPGKMQLVCIADAYKLKKIEPR